MINRMYEIAATRSERKVRVLQDALIAVILAMVFIGSLVLLVNTMNTMNRRAISEGPKLVGTMYTSFGQFGITRYEDSSFRFTGINNREWLESAILNETLDGYAVEPTEASVFAGLNRMNIRHDSRTAIPQSCFNKAGFITLERGGWLRC